jgi:hypothetical protein
MKPLHTKDIVKVERVLPVAYTAFSLPRVLRQLRAIGPNRTIVIITEHSRQITPTLIIVIDDMIISASSGSPMLTFTANRPELCDNAEALPPDHFFLRRKKARNAAIASGERIR